MYARMLLLWRTIPLGLETFQATLKILYTSSLNASLRYMAEKDSYITYILFKNGHQGPIAMHIMNPTKFMDEKNKGKEFLKVGIV